MSNIKLLSDENIQWLNNADPFQRLAAVNHLIREAREAAISFKEAKAEMVRQNKEFRRLCRKGAMSAESYKKLEKEGYEMAKEAEKELTERLQVLKEMQKHLKRRCRECQKT
jgi:hypothetical protein